MQQIDIIVGTTLGTAEYVADHLQEKLAGENIQSLIHMEPKLEDLLKNNDSLWLICTSTHGAGQAPDNILPFYNELQKKPNLSGRKFVVVALGCKDYDQFCEAGKSFKRILSDLGAHEQGSSLFIDSIQDQIPEDRVDLWFPEWISLLK